MFAYTGAIVVCLHISIIWIVCASLRGRRRDDVVMFSGHTCYQLIPWVIALIKVSCSTVPTICPVVDLLDLFYSA